MLLLPVNWTCSHKNNDTLYKISRLSCCNQQSKNLKPNLLLKKNTYTQMICYVSALKCHLNLSKCHKGSKGILQIKNMFPVIPVCFVCLVHRHFTSLRFWDAIKHLKKIHHCNKTLLIGFFNWKLLFSLSHTKHQQQPKQPRSQGNLGWKAVSGSPPDPPPCSHWG